MGQPRFATFRTSNLKKSYDGWTELSGNHPRAVTRDRRLTKHLKKSSTEKIKNYQYKTCSIKPLKERKGPWHLETKWVKKCIVPSEEMRAQRVPQPATNCASQRGPVWFFLDWLIYLPALYEVRNGPSASIPLWWEISHDCVWPFCVEGKMKR